MHTCIFVIYLYIFTRMHMCLFSLRLCSCTFFLARARHVQDYKCVNTRETRLCVLTYARHTIIFVYMRARRDCIFQCRTYIYTSNLALSRTGIYIHTYHLACLARACVCAHTFAHIHTYTHQFLHVSLACVSICTHISSRACACEREHFRSYTYIHILYFTCLK